MAGNVRTRERLYEVERDLAASQARVAELEGLLNVTTFEPGAPRQLTDKTRDTLIRDMLGRADQGQALDEIAAAWNIPAEELAEWGRVDVAFGLAIARARTRGRAAVLGSMRKLLESGRGIPAAFSDRMLALHDAGYGDDGGGDGLITVALPAPSDCQSCPHCGADLGGQGERQTQSESDAA